jgi:hypothetical protein
VKRTKKLGFGSRNTKIRGENLHSPGILWNFRGKNKQEHGDWEAPRIPLEIPEIGLNQLGSPLPTDQIVDETIEFARFRPPKDPQGTPTNKRWKQSKKRAILGAGGGSHTCSCSMGKGPCSATASSAGAAAAAF